MSKIWKSILVILLIFFFTNCGTPGSVSNFKKEVNIVSAVFSNDGKYLFTGGYDLDGSGLRKGVNIISQYDISGALIKTFEKTDKQTNIYNLLVSNDDRFLLTDSHLFDISSGKVLYEFEKERRAYVNSNGFRTASTSINNRDVIITINDRISGDIIKEVTIKNMIHNEIKIKGYGYLGPNERYYARVDYYSDDKTFYNAMWVFSIVDLDDPNLTVRNIFANSNFFEIISKIVVSEDNKYLAIGMTRSLFPIGELSSRKDAALSSATGGTRLGLGAGAALNSIYQKGINSEGSYNRETCVQIFEINSGKIINNFTYNREWEFLDGILTERNTRINSLEFSPDSSYIFITSNLGYVEGKLINNTWNLKKSNNRENRMRKFLCFTPDSKRFALYCEDGINSNWYSDFINRIQIMNIE